MAASGRQPEAATGLRASRHHRRRGIRQRERELALRHDAQQHAIVGAKILSNRAVQILLRDARISRQIALEVTWIVHEDAIGVQLIGLAAKAAERLQPVDELRLDLRVARAASRLRSGRRRSTARARRRSPAAARRACGREPPWPRPARTRRARASSETPSLRWRCAARTRAPCRAARPCRSRTNPTRDPSRRRRR